MDFMSFIANSRTTAQRLEDAVRTNNLSELDKLLDEGVDPNLRLHKEGGNTALHVAAYYGHFFCVARLIRAGASADKPNDIGITPLYNAARTNHPKAMHVLLSSSKCAFDFDRAWSDPLWSERVIASNIGNEVLSTLLIATPDISRARQNLISYLVNTCKEITHCRSFKLLLTTGNLRYNDAVKESITSFRRKLKDHVLPDKLEAVLDWYDEFFEPKTPLSLQYFCSLAVRKSFYGNCNVYYGVDCLRIPQTLKQYVRCDHIA